MSPDFQPLYSPWRHGGWYVDNVQHAAGGVGCVSRNYPDRKWRIVCAGQDEITYPNRDAAARAEHQMAEKEKETWPRCTAGGLLCRGFLYRHANGDYYPTCWNCGITASEGLPGHPFANPPTRTDGEHYVQP